MQEAVDNNIINLADIQSKIEDMKNQEYLKKHPYSIWEGEKNKKWYTYLPDESKPRKIKLLKRTTREALEKAVIKYWKEQESSKKIVTFKDVYFLWREKHDGTVADNTVVKYESDYNRFLSGSKFEKMPIKDIVDDDVNLFMVQTIKNNKLSDKNARDIFGYICNTFNTARKYKVMADNPVEFIKARDFYKHCYRSQKDVEDKIFSDEEVTKLLIQIQKHHEKKPNYMPSYAILLAIFTGMRVGELSALRWENIKDTCIAVDSSEKYNIRTKEFYIDKTKNGEPRKFPIDDMIRKLLDKIKAIQKEYGYDSEFVFANEKGRIHKTTISSSIRVKCKQAGIKQKGIHALRKSFNSALRCSGVSVVVASQLLGHTTVVNEKYYTFDTTNMAEKNRVVSAVNARFKKVTQSNTIPYASNY